MPGDDVGTGITWMFVLSGAGVFGNAIVLAVSARFLAIADIGFMTLVAMIRMLFLTCFSFGLPQAAEKFIANSAGMQQPDAARYTYRRLSRIGFFIGISGPFVILLLANPLASTIPQVGNAAFLLLLFSLELPAAMLSQFLHASLAALRQFKKTGQAALFGQLTRVVMAILFLLLGLGLLSVILCWILGAWVEVLIRLVHNRVVQRGIAQGFIDTRKLMEFSMPIYLSGVMEYGSDNIDRFFVLLIVGGDALGLYGPAIAIANLALLVPTSIAATSFPIVAQLLGSKEHDKLRAFSRGVIRWLLMLLMPFSFALSVESEAALTIIVGPEYVQAATALSILSLAVIISGLYRILKSFYLGLGKTDSVFYANFVAILVGGALGFYLVNVAEIAGAAISRFALFVVQATILLFFTARLDNIDIDISSAKKTAVACIFMGIVMYLSKVLFPVLLLFPLRVAFGVIAYSAALRFMKAVSVEDITTLQNLLPKQLASFATLAERILVSGSTEQAEAR